ncbi:MAG: hypothetical protein HeimC2_11140 [Candidatus Heimdallarchaeota archaeon LC_2]|nr:MAG: hypothetical protein HeimC2_11140 [Candidatus Heimdallarchaeota archaeon LC_2]
MFHDSIFVVDTETSGLCGYPEDLIFEIGIVEVNLRTLNIEIAYNEVIGYPIEDLTVEQQKAWIFDHSTLNLESVLKGKAIQEVAVDVQNLLNDKLVAMYNVAYDYEKFLKYEPFKLECTILPCIMKKSTKHCKVPHPHPKFKYKWPKLIEAQEILLDGIEIPDFIDPHRAISDAFISAKILLKLISNYDYPLNEYLKFDNVTSV